MHHPAMRPSVEETLRRLEDRIAKLRFLADAAAESAYDPPDKATWSGMRDARSDALDRTSDFAQRWVLTRSPVN